MEIQGKAKPIIEIYQDGLRYRVLIDGKEIENLKSFSIQIDNSRNGITVKEPAHYQIEQYIPFRNAGRSGSGSVYRLSAEPLGETP